MRARHTIEVGEDPRAVAETLAVAWEEQVDEALRSRGTADLVLAGGSTPEAFYRCLATSAWRDRFDWARIQLWFGDERCVGPEDAQSNFRMVREALLDHIPISPARVHRIRGELPPAEAALAYEALIRERMGQARSGPPVADLVLLGLGTDGHVASLFPGTTALEETERLAEAVRVDSLGVWRISLTFRMINAARRVMMLVTGEAKADVVKEVIEGGPTELPAKRVRPGQPLEWYLDRAAASGLVAR